MIEAELVGIEELARQAARLGMGHVADAGEHDYMCRCAACLHWWVTCGQDSENDSYGPFSDEEIEAAREIIKWSKQGGG